VRLPPQQRFKVGTSRRFAGIVTSAGQAVDLTSMTAVEVHLRRRRTTESVTAAALNLTAQGRFEVDVSALTVGRYWLELRYTDDDGGSFAAPEGLTTPGIEIEIYPGV
jgi:hypothetical protein